MNKQELIEGLDKYILEIENILKDSNEVESKGILKPLPDWAKTRLSQLWGNLKWMRAKVSA